MYEVYAALFDLMGRDSQMRPRLANSGMPLIEVVSEIYPKLLREKGWNHLLV